MNVKASKKKQSELQEKNILSTRQKTNHTDKLSVRSTKFKKGNICVFWIFKSSFGTGITFKIPKCRSGIKLHVNSYSTECCSTR